MPLHDVAACRNHKAIEFGRSNDHSITVRMARKTKTGEFAIVSLN